MLSSSYSNEITIFYYDVNLIIVREDTLCTEPCLKNHQVDHIASVNAQYSLVYNENNKLTYRAASVNINFHVKQLVIVMKSIKGLQNIVARFTIFRAFFHNKDSGSDLSDSSEKNKKNEDI